MISVFTVETGQLEGMGTRTAGSTLNVKYHSFVGFLKTFSNFDPVSSAFKEVFMREV